MLRIVPTTDKRSLGTRFMPESLKQMKTAIQNVLTHMLKKKEKLGRFQICHAKRNKYAEIPQERTQGDRKRKMIVPEDQVLSDKFLTQDVDQVECPEDLALKVGTVLLEADVARGTSVLKQIRRSFIKVANDSQGKPMIVVKGNVKRKTNRWNSKQFKPMDFKIRD